MDGCKSPVEIFDGSDYGFSRMQIKDYLYGKDLYKPLDDQPKDIDDAAWKVLDRKAISMVRLTLSRDVMFHVAKEKTTKSKLNVLADMFKKPSASNKVHLMRHLFNLKMSKGVAVASHLNKFSMITSQLDAFKILFDDEVRAFILLSSLSESWSGTVAVVSTSAEKECQNYVLRVHNLCGYEFKIKLLKRNNGTKKLFSLIMAEIILTT